ncbi:TetR family transcriptional regulator [Paenibacillus sp. CAA11]|uniref:TetR/AcrR family transcriptional regulator n=1 Tax=Paenibacillus sp. CAA11 TaxID=1532905 RepID=UPI000D355A59|nr:TetR/AcrR family transcriptional regulator [Paenibacillus sp. CAA11]AWB46021.1 TetR family transcriptional regulator [Paenibacillus sp. CAA11]
MPRAGLDQTAVLQAAAELADEHGIDALTLALVAQKLGIRSPSLYNHVDGLSGLRRKLAVHGLEQLYSRMDEAASASTPEHAAFALAEAYFSFASQRPGLYEATLRAPDAQDTDLEQAADRILELTLRVLQDTGLTGEASIHAVRGFRSLLHGFATLEGKGGFGIPLDLLESLRFSLRAYLGGLRQASLLSDKQE